MSEKSLPMRAAFEKPLRPIAYESACLLMQALSSLKSIRHPNFELDHPPPVRIGFVRFPRAGHGKQACSQIRGLSHIESCRAPLEWDEVGSLVGFQTPAVGEGRFGWRSVHGLERNADRHT